MVDRDDTRKPARLYFHQRAGGEAPALSFEKARRMVVATYSGLAENGWFQETFGYHCVDAGYVQGLAGSDPEGYIFKKTWLPGMWPLHEALAKANEAELFTLIEFLFDCISKPKDGRYHSWSDCGMHYETFERAPGPPHWRAEINEILQYLGEGYELSATGEVNRAAPDGLRELMSQVPPKAAADVNREKVQAAVRRYRHFDASRHDRLAAVRDLVDVLEYYRREIKTSRLTKDESDLFQIANRFAIRHNRSDQQSDYGNEWLDWLFHLYLSTVHLALRLVHGADPIEPEPEPEPEPESDPFPF